MKNLASKMSAIPHIDATSCSEITQNSKSNFLSSFRFLSEEKKEAMVKFYAFSRILDDCVDEPLTLPEKKLSLEYWRMQLLHTYEGNPEHPVMKELQAVINRFEVPQEYLFGIIRGCEMDLEKNRYETLEELYNYCRHVAGLVGFVCLRIFEADSPETQKMAIELGNAFQLTNIIRDVKADLELNRIYVPLKIMGIFGYTEEDLKGHVENENFFRMMKHLTQIAESHYQSAFQALKNDKQGKLKAAKVMASVYHKILQKIKKQNYPVFKKRVSLNPVEKILSLVSLL